ncbi:MAG: DHHW family protein [Ignavibacteriales bacterium]
MKKINFNIFLFILFVYCFSCLTIIGSFKVKSSISVLENRALQRRPALTLNSIFNGSYFKEYENYFSDNFIFRDNFVFISNNIKKIKGFTNKDGASIVQHKGENIAEIPKKKIEPKQEIQDNDILKNKEETQENDKSGSFIGELLILNDTAMTVFHFYQRNCLKYSKIINQFTEKSARNINIYSLLVPTQIEFISSSKYKNISDSQKNAIDFINKHFNNKVKVVDAYLALKQNRDKYIYFRTDHHWTALGAYYAYTAFTISSGVKSIPIEQYKTEKVTGFLGSSYSETLNKKLEKNPDTITLYKPFIKNDYNIFYDGPLKMNLLDMNHAEKKNKYRIFLSGDRPLGIIKTEVKNGRKILVVKDSFGNAFIPFLLPHYEEIFIVDPRQYNKNILNLINDNGIQDVLFLNYTSAAGMPDYNEFLAELLN